MFFSLLKILTLKIIKFILRATLLMLVTCATNSQNSQINNINIDYYLQQLKKSINYTHFNYQLFIIHTLMKQRYLLAAQQQLTILQVPPELQCEYLLLSAECALALHLPQKTIVNLRKINHYVLTNTQYLRYINMMKITIQHSFLLDLIRSYINYEPLLQDQVTYQQNIDSIWQTLLLLPIYQENIIINTNEYVLQSWLQLLHIYLYYHHNPKCLRTIIKYWQINSDSRKPAFKILPTHLMWLQNHQPLLIKDIALLLPLRTLDKTYFFAEAIKQGFLAAKNSVHTELSITSQSVTNNVDKKLINNILNQYSVISKKFMTNFDEKNIKNILKKFFLPIYNKIYYDILNNCSLTLNDNNIKLKIYDTSNHSIPDILLKAQKNGSRMIIGPLLKHEVEQLNNINIRLTNKLNILALNQPQDQYINPNICYFALTPENEAQDAANHIYQHGYKSPLLLLPRNSIGDRVAKAFAEVWNKKGKNTVLVQRIGSITELKHSINNGVGIQLIGVPLISNNPAINMRELTLNKSQNIAEIYLYNSKNNNNNCIDAVYIIATPDEISFIKTMIDLNINDKKKLALYASSRSYHSNSSLDFRLEMEGLELSNIPFITQINSKNLSHTINQFYHNNTLVYLYAMGIDAWILAHYFNEIRNIPGFKLYGKTGLLSSTPQCIINRKLSWFKYHQGELMTIE